jgi:AcrR family transcriptional regulator
MRARADAAAATGERIVAAAYERFGSQWYDDITLEAVAGDANVTVQTVLRRFGSKEGLVRAVGAQMRPRVEAQRDGAPAGDPPAAMRNLLDHYEAEGDKVARLLNQEDRVEAFGEITRLGRRYHAEWVERVFESWLARLEGAERHRLRAQLIAACDVQTWLSLRRQSRLSRRQTEIAMLELVEGLLP